MVRMSSLRARRLQLTRAVAPLAAAGLLVVVAAGPAAAHVTVSSPDAAPGGFGKLVFRVPSESDTASTTKVEVALPESTPFAFVSTKPHPGWTIATTERTLDKPVKAEGFTLTKEVATITWTAEKGQGINVGELDEFELSVGPFPDKAGPISLPATQAYSDGAVVNWNEPVTDGKAEPEHPAPTLELAGEATTPSRDQSDPLARWLAVAGVILAGAAVLVALIGIRRRAT